MGFKNSSEKCKLQVKSRMANETHKTKYEQD